MKKNLTEGCIETWTWLVSKILQINKEEGKVVSVMKSCCVSEITPCRFFHNMYLHMCLASVILTTKLMSNTLFLEIFELVFQSFIMLLQLLASC